MNYFQQGSYKNLIQIFHFFCLLYTNSPLFFFHACFTFNIIIHRSTLCIKNQQIYNAHIYIFSFIQCFLIISFSGVFPLCPVCCSISLIENGGRSSSHSPAGILLWFESLNLLFFKSSFVCNCSWLWKPAINIFRFICVCFG